LPHRRAKQYTTIAATRWRIFLRVAPRCTSHDERYLTDFMSTNLIVIDGNTNEVSLRPVPLYSSFVTVNPANGRVYVSNSNDATVTVIQE
jgi:hypothetical protein